MITETKNDELRDQAITILKKKRDLRSHALVYLLINGVTVVIWALTGHGFFWPMFLMLAWGVGLVMNVWDVYYNHAPTEDEVRREMERQRGASR